MIIRPHQTLYRWTAGLLLALIISTQLLVPLSARAALIGVPIAENSVTDVTTFGSTTWILRYIINPIARAALRAVIVAITQQIVGWISGNGGSNVGFVGNLETAFVNEVDARAGEFLQQLDLIDFCGDIGIYLQINLRGGGGLRQQTGCTLSAAVKNVRNWYADFQQGGWQAFLKVNTDFRNNTGGALLLTTDLKLIGEARRAEAFLKPYEKSSITGFKIKVPSGQNCVKDNNPEDPENVTEVCYQTYEEKTPGTIIEGALKKATVDTGIDFGVNAKDFDEAITAIVGALLQRVISASLGGNGIFGSNTSQPQIGNPSTFVPVGIPDTYSEITPTQEALRSVIHGGMYRAYGTLTALDSRIIALRVELSGLPRSSARAIQIEAETQSLLNNKFTVLNAESGIFLTKRASFSATTLDDIRNASNTLISHVAAFAPIQTALGALPSAGVTGDMKRDGIAAVQGEQGVLGTTINLINQAVAEINTILTSSTTLSAGNAASLSNYRISLTTSNPGHLTLLQKPQNDLQTHFAALSQSITTTELFDADNKGLGAAADGNAANASASRFVQQVFSFLDSIQ